MMGHQRRGARKKYDYDEITIREAYQRAFEYLSINGMQTRNDIAKLKEDFVKTKSQFMDMLAEEKQKRESERQELFDFIHKDYDPILYTFHELVNTPEGKAALRKLQEDKREKVLQEFREAEEELQAMDEEQFEKEKSDKLPPKKQDKAK